MGLSNISSVGIVYSSSIVVPTSACELETTSAQQGLLVAGPLIGAIPGAVLWGYLADTRGRRSMLLASFLAAVFFNIIASFSVNWIMLLVFQFVASMMASGQYSLSITLLSESVPMARRNVVVLIVASTFLLSQGVMAILAIPIIPLDFSYYIPALDIYWTPWRTVMLTYCIPSLISCLWLFFMKESPKYIFTKGDEEGALNILRAIHKMNNKNTKEEYQVKGLLAETLTDDEKSKKNITELFKPPLLKYFIIMTLLSIFLKVGAFMVWLPTIANQFVQILNTGEGLDLTICGILEEAQTSPPDTNLPPCALNETSLLIVFGVGLVLSLFNIVVSLVVDSAGRRNTVMVIAAVCGVSGILVNLVPSAIGSAVLFAVFLLSMVNMGLYTAISVALFPTHLRASAVSLTMTGGSIVLFGLVQLLNYLLVNNCDLGFYLLCSLVAGFGAYSYALTALTGLSIVSYVCVIYSSAVIAPASACELETTPAQQGLLAAGPLVGTIPGGVTWGYLADRRGRRRVLLASFLAGALVSGLASLSTSWTMLVVMQFFSATMASGQYSLSMTLLSESVPMARRNVVVLIVASIFMLAQGIMALLALPIIPLDFSIHLSGLNIHWTPWRTVLLIYCLPSLVCLAWLYLMQESPKYYYSKGNDQDALDVLRTIHRINHRNSKEELQVKGLLPESEGLEDFLQEATKKKMSELFKPPLLKYFIIMTVLSIFLQIGAFMVWLPTIAHQFVNIVRTNRGARWTLCDIIGASRGATPDPSRPPCSLNETALLLVLAVGCVQSLFNVSLGFVVNKAGRRNSVVALAAVSGAAGAVVNLIPHAVASAVLFVVFLLGITLLGLYTAMSVALFPTHLRALAISLTMTGGRVALFAAVQVLNYLLQHDCGLAFYLMAAIVIASAAVALLLPDDRLIGEQKTPVP